MSSFVPTFLSYASPAALLVFNLALCAGALMLGRRKPGSSKDETFAAWFVGVMWGGALVLVQFKLAKDAAPSVWMFALVGVITAAAAGFATRTALVGREPTFHALYLVAAIVASGFVGLGAELHPIAANDDAYNSAFVVLSVGVLSAVAKLGVRHWPARRLPTRVAR